MAELKIPDDLPEMTADQVSRVAMQIIAENLRSVSGEHDRTMFVRKLAKILETERISTLTAERDALKEQVEKMDILAEAGLCQFSVGGKHEFLKDIRQIAADAEIQGGITHVAARAAEKGPSNG
jgi:delta-aminolevulinic acid dehydratase/porphobilinogen synthase